MGRDDEKIVQLFPKRDFEDRHWYRLEGHTPVAMRTFGEWEAVMIDRMERARHGNDPWRVAYTDIGEAGISTVFLGLNHNFFGGGPPLLFETIIFGGHLDEFMNRCSTWEEAEKMHAAAVELMRAKANG